MSSPIFRSILLLGALAAVPAVRAANLPPREIWPQVAAAASEGELDLARKKASELTDTGKAYGIKTFPVYAATAAAIARTAQKNGQPEVASWASKVADMLDPRSPAVAFINSDRAADKKLWPRAANEAFRGMQRVFGSYRTSVLAHSDMIIVASLAIALTAAVFALSLFIRYGRAIAHDFREMLSRRFEGGAVSVLGFALLFLPIFLWLGPMWLVFYWFVIVFTYASPAERIAIVALAVLMAVTPIAGDWAASRIAGVDSPVVSAALSSREQSYQPEALRRMQELTAFVPENATLQVLLGNLQLFEGNEQQAGIHYHRSSELRDSAGAHVNIGNLHFLNNDFVAAMNEYQRAQKLDPHLAIAFYNDSVASGETYRFDEQGRKLEMAKKVDQSLIERLSANPLSQKIVIYSPPIDEAWQISSSIGRRGAAKSLFGTNSYFDPATSAANPITLGALASVLLAVAVWLKRRRSGIAGSCIKCGRTFCPRCKSARESATYCTQCIHIYLKRDGVSLDTKRSKLEEVSQYHTGMQRRNRLLATFLPGAAQVAEGRTVKGVLAIFIFLFLVFTAIFIGRLAPALAPVAETAQLFVRILAIALAAICWFFVSVPVYRRRMTTA